MKRRIGVFFLFAIGFSSVAVAQADLALIKTVSNATPNVGDTITFTVTLSNAGPLAATSVTVNDLLPAGLTFVSATPSQGTYNSGTGVWTVGAVPAGVPLTLTIQAQVAASAARTNTASIGGSSQPDPNTGNNIASATETPQQAELAILKEVDNPTPNVGDIINFTVILANQGPDSATAVTVSDQLPAGLNFISATPSQGVYNSGTGIWTVGTVAPAGTAVLQIVAQVAVAGFASNTATISHSDQFDPNSANNADSVSQNPTEADLLVTKRVSNPTPNLGDQITFTVAVRNAGPANATNVQITDVLPPGLSIVTATPSQGVYDSGTGIWIVGAVNFGSMQTLSIDATVVSPNALTNTAAIVGVDQFDPNAGNSADSATVTPQQADLAITKIVSTTTPNVGSQVTFTITVRNAGPRTATGVQISDLLPAGLTFFSATPSQGTYNAGTGIWTLGSVSSAAPQTLAIVATVASPGSKTNTATVSASDQFDPNGANNSGSATVAPTQADLAISKTVNNPTPNVGSQITFTITLQNFGPDTATGVQVTDLLPAGLTFASATPSQGTYTSGSGIWNVGTVTVGAIPTLSIVATVATSSANTNTATITASNQFDSNTGNNSASATATPQQANLSISKTVNNPTPNVGTQVTFTITLQNAGPDTATGVQVTDLLPAGLTFVSATPSQGTYTSGSGIWNVGTVAIGSQTLSIVATVAASSARTNTATISASNQFDPNTANNSASATETPQQANIAMTNVASAPTALSGSNFSWTVTATNNGPDTATNVTVTDLVPAGVSFVSATPSQGTYNSATGAWAIGTLANSAAATLILNVTAGPPATVTDTASVSHSDQFDPNTANDSASSSVTIQALAADLGLGLAVDNATPNVGAAVTLTVTLQNIGPNDATGVTVTDLLPAGLTFVSAAPSQGSYVSATGAWTVGAIANGATATLTIAATVTSATPGTDTASITASSATDPDPTNNTASVTITPQQSDIAVTNVASNSSPLSITTFTWTATATNNGPASATNVSISDVLPAGVTFVSATASQGTYNSATGTWTLGTLANAASATLVLTVKAGAPATVTDTVAVSGADQSDPNAANNSASSTVTIQANPAIPMLSPLVLMLFALTLTAFGVATLRR
jgi:uncharacterized repeat protein (TIGR01451 family)